MSLLYSGERYLCAFPSTCMNVILSITHKRAHATTILMFVSTFLLMQIKAHKHSRCSLFFVSSSTERCRRAGLCASCWRCKWVSISPPVWCWLCVCRVCIRKKEDGHQGESTKGDLKANIKRHISSLMHVGVTPTRRGTTQTHQKRLLKLPSWPSSHPATGRLWNPPTSRLMDLNVVLFIKSVWTAEMDRSCWLGYIYTISRV